MCDLGVYLCIGSRLVTRGPCVCRLGFLLVCLAWWWWWHELRVADWNRQLWDLVGSSWNRQHVGFRWFITGTGFLNLTWVTVAELRTRLVQ